MAKTMTEKFGRGYTLAIVATICATVLVAITIVLDQRMIGHLLPLWGKFELILFGLLLFTKEIRKIFVPMVKKFIPGIKNGDEK